MSIDIAVKLQELGYRTIDSTYRDKVSQWMEWYQGDVKSFHRFTIYNGTTHVKRQRKTLGMAKCIAEDWANLLLNERVAIHTDDGFKPVLDAVLDRNKFYLRANQLIELAYALGTGALVEYKNGADIDVDYINGVHIYPTEWDNGTITGCAFGSIKVIQSVECCYIQIHQRNEFGNYIISNYICDNLTGKEMSDAFYASADVKHEFDTRSPVPKYQIIMPNIINNSDLNCPMGISVYANSIPVLQTLDIVYDSYANEFDMGRKRMIIPLSMARMEAGDGTFRPVFDPQDTVFYAMPNDTFAEDKKGPVEINMAIRAAEHEAGIKLNLSLLSKKCGLGNDRYQFDHDGVKTATEVVSEKSDLYQNLKKHELLLQDALLGMVEAIADISGMGPVHTSVSFDDSVINDDNTKLDNHIKRIDAMLETHADAIADINSLTLEEAQKKYQAIVDEQRSITGQDIDSYGQGDSNDDDGSDGGHPDNNSDDDAA